MGYPADLSLVTLHGQYTLTDGSAASGSVVFTPTVPRINDPTHNMILIQSPLVVDLDSDGEFRLSIPATNDPDLNPDFQYTVQTVVAGVDQSTYLIDVPYDTVGTLELADMT